MDMMVIDVGLGIGDMALDVPQAVVAPEAAAHVEVLPATVVERLDRLGDVPLRDDRIDEDRRVGVAAAIERGV